jgi:hypothetical protein
MLLTTHILDTREASIDMHNDNKDKIFADGSGLLGKAGTAAALFRGNHPPKELWHQ